MASAIMLKLERVVMDQSFTLVSFPDPTNPSTDPFQYHVQYRKRSALGLVGSGNETTFTQGINISNLESIMARHSLVSKLNPSTDRFQLVLQKGKESLVTGYVLLEFVQSQ